MKKVAAAVLTVGALFAIAACGKGQEYADEVCKCKEKKGADAGKCLTDVTTKYKDEKPNEKQAEQIGKCTKEIGDKALGDAMGQVNAALSNLPAIPSAPKP